MPKKSPKRLEDCNGIPVQKSFDRVKKSRLKPFPLKKLIKSIKQSRKK